MLKDNSAVLSLSVTLCLARRSWEARSGNKALLVWVINQNWQGWGNRRGVVRLAGGERSCLRLPDSGSWGFSNYRTKKQEREEKNLARKNIRRGLRQGSVLKVRAKSSYRYFSFNKYRMSYMEHLYDYLVKNTEVIRAQLCTLFWFSSVQARTTKLASATATVERVMGITTHCCVHY